MKKKIMQWYNFMPYISVFYALVLGIHDWDLTRRALLLSIIVIHLHFYEEFGLPGGFAWGGIKVEMRHVSKHVAEWPLNQLSALFGNEWFAIVVYLPALFLTQYHWLTLAVIIFAFVELLVHMVVFNVGLKTWYNPGLVTSLFGLTPISIWYLYHVLPTGQYNWWDLAYALCWLAFNYWVAFRSQLFQFYNNQKQYTFTATDLSKSAPYMAKFGLRPTDYDTLAKNDI